MTEPTPERVTGSGVWPEVPERLKPSPGVSPRPQPAAGRDPAAPSTEQPPRPTPASEAATTPLLTTTGARPAMPPRGPRRAHLAIRRVDPWSVLKMTFVFSLGLLVVGLVAIVVLYGILDGMGVFTSITRFLHDVSASARSAQSYATLPRVFGFALLIGVVNVILLTALATLGAFVYNLCVDLVGGIEVTLTERD